METLNHKLLKYGLLPAVAVVMKAAQVGVCYTLFPEKTGEALSHVSDSIPFLALIIATSPKELVQAYDNLSERSLKLAGGACHSVREGSSRLSEMTYRSLREAIFNEEDLDIRL